MKKPEVVQSKGDWWETWQQSSNVKQTNGKRKRIRFSLFPDGCAKKK